MPDFRRAEDLYELLEVSPRASREVIQAAYRVHARVYHPDLNATSEAGCRIRELNNAYRVLSSPPERARYDLERTRARRHEWAINPEQVEAGSGLSRPVRRQPRFARAAAAARPIEGRWSMLSGQVIVGMILVATIALVAFGLVWASLDSSADNAPMYRRPAVEFIGR